MAIKRKGPFSGLQELSNGAQRFVILFHFLIKAKELGLKGRLLICS